MFIVSEDLSKLIEAFVSWGFMMALLFNLVSYSDPSMRSRSPLWITVIINISYACTSPISPNYFLYPSYILADLLTIACIFWVQKYRYRTAAFYYCCFFLCCNSLLHTAIFIDFDVLGNTDAWWLWTLYSTGINFNDAMMIIVLIINRDFLGLCRAGNCLKTIFQREA
ncbi:hypothetical protein [Pseudoalteromonas sp. GB56]